MLQIHRVYIILVLPWLLLINSVVNANPRSNSTHEKTGQLAVFELRYRTAPELLPLIKPFLDPKSVIRANNNKLVIRTNRPNLDEITRLISRLDKKLRNLRISLRQTTTPLKTSDSDYRLHGDNTIYSTLRTTTVTSNFQQQDITQTVVVSENKPAWISAVKTFPSVVQAGRRKVVIKHRSLSSGFYVRARLTQSGVEISINTQRQRHNPSQGNRTLGNHQQTVRTAPLGVWFNIGGSTNAYKLKSSSPDHTYTLERTASKQTRHYLLLKVDLLP